MIVLVLGGSRSGKSTVAERLTVDAAVDGGAVTYVATMRAAADDADLTDRVAAHRARRLPHWSTVEPPYDLAAVLSDTPGTVLVDSLGPWVADQPDMEVDLPGLIAALRDRPGPTVIVSDEVGWGVHPATTEGLRFRDALGTVNQAIADVADEVLLVVAGRVLPLERR